MYLISNIIAQAEDLSETYNIIYNILKGKKFIKCKYIMVKDIL